MKTVLCFSTESVDSNAYKITSTVQLQNSCSEYLRASTTAALFKARRIKVVRFVRKQARNERSLFGNASTKSNCERFWPRILHLWLLKMWWIPNQNAFKQMWQVFFRERYGTYLRICYFIFWLFLKHLFFLKWLKKRCKKMSTFIHLGHQNCHESRSFLKKERMLKYLNNFGIQRF